MAFLEELLDKPVRSVLPQIQRRVVSDSKYFGVPTLKCPLDFWICQEIITEGKPDVIVEIGNMHGGSLLAWAHLCDALGHGRVIGVDLNHQPIHDFVRRHLRIKLITGDACGVFPRVLECIEPNEQVLVFEDSSHTYEGTLNILRAYSRLVSPGSYLIVEDGICHHGLETGPSPGPYETIEAFIPEHPEFEIDRRREAFGITWNPKGYLRRR